MYKNCYGICFTPETYNSYKDKWSYFDGNKDSYLIVDNSTNNQLDYDCFTYTEKDIRKNFNFNLEVSKNHYWNSYGNRNIVWFYAYLRMINFYLSHPNYEYYWFFDDDVYCDNWDEFIKGFDNEDSDFLSYFLFKNSDVDSYPLVPKADYNMHSGPDWFRRFPGEQDMLDNAKEYFGSFFAIVRYSNKAMKELINLTKNGFSGYGEGFVPTSLAKLGYKINTIYNNDNTSNYFDVDRVNVIHKNQKINWEWL
jgi:hypothetical protein